MKKRLYMCALALAMTVSITACGGSDKADNNTAGESSDNSTDDEAKNEPKEITSDDLSITLTADFGKSVTEDYNFYYSSSSAICIGIRETKEELSSNNITINSINDYASIIMEKSGITAEPTPVNDNAVYFEWNKTIKDKDYSYIGYVTTSTDACWLIQFGCLTEKYEELKPQFLKYLDTVKVN